MTIIQRFQISSTWWPILNACAKKEKYLRKLNVCRKFTCSVYIKKIILYTTHTKENFKKLIPFSCLHVWQFKNVCFYLFLMSLQLNEMQYKNELYSPVINKTKNVNVHTKTALYSCIIRSLSIVTCRFQ